MKYLKGTFDMKTQDTSYLKPGTSSGFVDADWANYTTDGMSTTGYLFLFGGGTIS